MKLFIQLFVLIIAGSRTHAMPWNSQLQEMLPTFNLGANLRKELGISMKMEDSKKSDMLITTIKNATMLFPFISTDEMEVKLEVIPGPNVIVKLSLYDVLADKELGNAMLNFDMETHNWEVKTDFGEIGMVDMPSLHIQAADQDYKFQLDVNMANGHGDSFELSCKSHAVLDLDFKISSTLQYNEHKYNLVGKHANTFEENKHEYKLNGDGLLVEADWRSNIDENVSIGKLILKAGSLNYAMNFKSEYLFNNAEFSMTEENQSSFKGQLEYSAFPMMFKMSGNYMKKGENCECTLESEPGMQNLNFTEVCNGAKDWEGYINLILDRPRGKDVKNVKFGLRNRKGEVLNGHVTNKVPIQLSAEIEMPNLLGKKYSAKFGFYLMEEKIAAVVQEDNVKYGVEVTKFFFFSSRFDAAVYLGNLGTVEVNLASSSVRNNPHDPNSNFELGAKVLYNQASICHLNFTETFGWTNSYLTSENFEKREGIIGLQLTVLDGFSFLFNAKKSSEKNIGTFEFDFELKVLNTRYTADGSLGIEEVTFTLEAENSNGILYGANPLCSYKIDIVSNDSDRKNKILTVDVSYALLSGDKYHYTSETKYVDNNSIDFTMAMGQDIDVALHCPKIHQNLKCMGVATIFDTEYEIESFIELSFPLDKNKDQYIKITKDKSKFAFIEVSSLSREELLIKYDVKGIRSGEVAINASKTTLTVQDSPDQGPGWTFKGFFTSPLRKEEEFGYELKIGDKVDSSYLQTIAKNRDGRFNNMTQTTKWFIANSSNLYPLTCFHQCYNSYITEAVYTEERGTEFIDVSYQEFMDGILQSRFHSKILSDPMDFYVQFPFEVMNTVSLRLKLEKAVLQKASSLMASIRMMGLA